MIAVLFFQRALNFQPFFQKLFRKLCFYTELIKFVQNFIYYSNILYQKWHILNENQIYHETKLVNRSWEDRVSAAFHLSLMVFTCGEANRSSRGKLFLFFFFSCFIEIRSKHPKYSKSGKLKIRKTPNPGNSKSGKLKFRETQNPGNSKSGKLKIRETQIPGNSKSGNLKIRETQNPGNSKSGKESYKSQKSIIFNATMCHEFVVEKEKKKLHL